jgi:hypothetical protein
MAFSKKTAILAFLLLLGIAGFLSAQEQQTSHFSRTYYITKIAPHQLGYRVIYLTEAGTPFVTYLPMEWFSSAGGKASLQFRWETSAPYMQVFWQNGEFSHMRIVVPPTYDDPSWGVVPASIDATTSFAVDTLVLHYE